MDPTSIDFIPQKDAVSTALALGFPNPIVKQITENNFRTKIGWNSSNGPLAESYDENVESAKSQFPSVFEEDDFSYDMLSEVITKAEKKLKERSGRVGDSQIYFLFYNNTSKETDRETDVRGLMENIGFKGAAFQFASTMFGYLEGGKYKFGSTLSELHEGAVQGEFASISTIGGALYRKYGLPQKVKQELIDEGYRTTDDAISGQYKIEGGYKVPKTYMDEFKQAFNNRMYTLEHFTSWSKKRKPKKGSSRPENRLPYSKTTGRGGFRINSKSVKGYKYSSGDANWVKIPIHKNVTVHYGYGADLGIDIGQKRLGGVKIPKLDGSQKVTCILSSTVDLDKRKGFDATTRRIEQVTKLQQVLQVAAYRGAIYGAFISDCDKVVLTAVGGGSFKNDPKIIYGAIYKVLTERFRSGLSVQNLGMQIYVPIRFDKRWQRRDFYPNFDAGEAFQKLMELASVKEESKERAKTLVSQYAYKFKYDEKVDTIVKELNKLQGITDLLKLNPAYRTKGALPAPQAEVKQKQFENEEALEAEVYRLTATVRRLQEFQEEILDKNSEVTQENIALKRENRELTERIQKLESGAVQSVDEESSKKFQEQIDLLQAKLLTQEGEVRKLTKDATRYRILDEVTKRMYRHEGFRVQEDHSVRRFISETLEPLINAGKTQFTDEDWAALNTTFPEEDAKTKIREGENAKPEYTLKDTTGDSGAKITTTRNVQVTELTASEKKIDFKNLGGDDLSDPWDEGYGYDDDEEEDSSHIY